VSFGLALSTGHESLGEYLDVDLDADPASVDLDALPARLDPALPAGVAVQGAAVVQPGVPSLQEAVTSCVWRIEVVDTDPGEVGAAVERLLDADQLVVHRERKGHPVAEDLRSALLDLALVGPTLSGTELVAELATQPRALRPGDVVPAIGEFVPGVSAGRVCRTHQFTGADASRREPLPSPVGLDGWSLAAAGTAPDHTEGLPDVRRSHHPSREGGRAD
jgi:radical SAM-linked protein